MGTEAAKLIYRLRGQTAELVTRNVATAASGTCRYAADLAVVSWDCSTRLLIIWLWWRDCVSPDGGQGLSANLRKRVNIGRIFEAAEELVESWSAWSAVIASPRAEPGPTWSRDQEPATRQKTHGLAVWRPRNQRSDSPGEGTPDRSRHTPCAVRGTSASDSPDEGNSKRDATARDTGPLMEW